MDALPLGTVTALLSALAAISVTAILAALMVMVPSLSESVVSRHTAARGVLVAVIAAATASCAFAVITMLMGGRWPIPGALHAPVIALAALCAVLALSTSTIRGIPQLSVATIAVTLLGFLPASLTAFSTNFTPFGTGIGVLDFGGVTAALVVPAVVALTVSAPLSAPPSAPPSAPLAASGVRAVDHSPGPRVLGMAMLVAVASLGWLVGIELAIDSSTPVIVINAILMPLCGALGGAVTERLRHRQNTRSGLIVGILSAVGASAAACSFLTTEIAAVLALVCGGLATLTSSLCGPTLQNLAIKPLLCGSVLGLVSLGLFATNLGLNYNGQPELLVTQLLIALGSVLLGLLTGLLIRVTGRVMRRK